MAGTTFKDLLIALNSLKNKAKEMGLKEKDIQNLKIVDVNAFNMVVEKNLDISLGKKGLDWYLLMKEKKM